jgi:hypothetical protein
VFLVPGWTGAKEADARRGHSVILSQRRRALRREVETDNGKESLILTPDRKFSINSGNDCYLEVVNGLLD